MAVTRGWREGKMGNCCLMGIEFVLQGEKVLESYTLKVIKMVNFFKKTCSLAFSLS